MTTKQSAEELLGADSTSTTGARFPEFDPDFPARAKKELAEHALKEALVAKAATRGTSVTGLALITAAQVLSIQGGSVIGNKQKDLDITFDPPVENPTFIITNLFNKNNSSSDISYTNLTSKGVTVKRGYTNLTSKGVTVNRGNTMTAGGLQDFSWVVLSVPNPTQAVQMEGTDGVAYA